ncbi:heme ABC transporter ATP-binding protein [Lamprobacter modestohalophilus]|uniref:heme ABC transporter ATP-binding protein n=1 Tax=Lamprobacter modestohalophilus TaxID=1064514 RepID=UPI002ADEB3EA|nr:heme ABC transporter ATP-binding protein [Lamprobacter modestohalophilus]MEA1051829.1 heme ABC transporter ATP-binding protein [Lamprobacter modestohalophilus]
MKMDIRPSVDPGSKILEATGLCIRRDGRALLYDLSLRLAAGEVLAVLGANGAGKSTLLRTLSAELSPERGQVRLNNRPLSDWPARELAKRRAVLPQHSPLDFPFTALEVVLMGRIPFGGPSSEDVHRAARALGEVEIAHLAERRYTTLSGGERQRVHLARVLVQIWDPLPEREPRFLLLDEPTASLDIAHQHATLALARRWARHDLGVLVVLHDLNLAAQYADRVAILKAGRLLAVGAPEDALEPDLIAEAFGLPVQILAHPELGCPLIVPRADPSSAPRRPVHRAQATSWCPRPLHSPSAGAPSARVNRPCTASQTTQAHDHLEL